MKVLLLFSIFSCSAYAAESTTEKVAASAKETKEEFTQKMNQQLAKLAEQIDILKKEAILTSSKTTDHIDKDLVRLEKKRADLKKSLDETTASTGRAWGQVQTGFEKAYADLKRGFAKAEQEFKSKK